MKQTDANLNDHIDTAYHEAGHALVCLLERRPIHSWQILADDKTQVNRRMNLRRAHTNGVVVSGGKDDDLLESMAGYAAEMKDVFLPPHISTYPELLDHRRFFIMSDTERDDPYPYTDQELAWIHVALAHERLDGSGRPGRIARCIRFAYESVRQLFERQDFLYAIDDVAAYMLRRGEEMDPDINARMMTVLDTYGCTADVRNEMRRAMRALDLPGIVRRFAYPRYRKAA